MRTFCSALDTGGASPPLITGTIEAVARDPSLDDERGVDRGQIRALLALSPAERVDRLIAAVEVWNEILTQAGTRPQSR
jgi:hypothetical protein